MDIRLEAFKILGCHFSSVSVSCLRMLQHTDCRGQGSICRFYDQWKTILPLEPQLPPTVKGQPVGLKIIKLCSPEGSKLIKLYWFGAFPMCFILPFTWVLLKVGHVYADEMLLRREPTWSWSEQQCRFNLEQICWCSREKCLWRTRWCTTAASVTDCGQQWTVWPNSLLACLYMIVVFKVYRDVLIMQLFDNYSEASLNLAIRTYYISQRELQGSQWAQAVELSHGGLCYCIISGWSWVLFIWLLLYYIINNPLTLKK